MTAETDAEFVERVALVFEHEGYVADIDWPILFALARRGAEAEAEYSDGYHDGYENGADATAHWVADYEHVKSEITRLRTALLHTLASLEAAIGLLERGGKAAKKAAASDTMFDIMLKDYRTQADKARAALKEDGDE